MLYGIGSSTLHNKISCFYSQRLILSFCIFLSHHLQSPITQKKLEKDEKFFLLFKADEIAFAIKYVVSVEAH